MTITESTLRRIIREEAKKALREMPYAGDLGVRRSTDQESESFIASGISDTGANRKGAEKYARSGRFKMLAKRHFDNIPYNVWVAPLIGVPNEAGVDDDPETGNRGKILDLVPEGIEMLERLGFQAPARVGSGDLVILYSAMVTDINFLATPWMVMHSIFDTNSMTEELIPGYQALNNMIVFGDTEPEDDALMPLMNLTDNAEASEYVVRRLTMASARNELLAGGGDILAEMMCQELLTKGGLRINFTTAPEKENALSKAIRALASRVKLMAADFRRNAQGKLIVTAVN